MRESIAPTRILIIEDDGEMVLLLTDLLGSRGYEVLAARDGVAGLDLLRKQPPHLVLLDIRLPRMDGFETLRRIRELSDVPIVVLSGVADESDKVRALDLGANDYVTKPFSGRELLARLRVGLRPHDAQHATGMVRVDDWLSVDRDRCVVLVGGHKADLSPIEFKLLCCFLDNPNRVLAHQTLLTQVWGWEYADESQYLKVHINHLRHKIEPDPSQPRYIVTVRGLGYMFQVAGES
jgi:two-component system KDP operon response regulator KdpE